MLTNVRPVQTLQTESARAAALIAQVDQLRSDVAGKRLPRRRTRACLNDIADQLNELIRQHHREVLQ